MDVQQEEQEVKVETALPESNVKNGNMGVKIAVGILASLVLLAYWGYVTLLKPYLLVIRATAHTAKYDAAEIVYTSNDKKVVVTGDLAGTDKLSKVVVQAQEMGGDEKSNLTTEMLVDKGNVYLTANYSSPEFIEQTLVSVYPPIIKTKTYKMANPLWKGEKWLHIVMPETEKKEEVKKEEISILSTEEGRKLAWEWFLAIKPIEVKRGYMWEGQKYTKVVFGFRKNQLIQAINHLKDMNIDVKVSQINAIVKAVKSSDDWDRDLVTVLIDDKDVRVISMKLPQIDDKVLDESIQEGMGEGGSKSFLVGMAGTAKKLVLGKEDAKMIELGSITLGKFDNVETYTKPEPVIEATDLMTVAETELGPIIAQLFGGAASTSTKTTTPTTQRIVATPAPVKCIQFKIREGEFASDKCYSTSDYNDLMYYTQQYNNAIFTYNGAAGQANVTCNGFSDNFKQQCEVNKQEMQKAEADKQNYANIIRGIIARGK